MDGILDTARSVAKNLRRSIVQSRSNGHLHREKCVFPDLRPWQVQLVDIIENTTRECVESALSPSPRMIAACFRRPFIDARSQLMFASTMSDGLNDADERSSDGPWESPNSIGKNEAFDTSRSKSMAENASRVSVQNVPVTEAKPAGGSSREERVLVSEVLIKDKEGGDVEDPELLKIIHRALRASRPNSALTTKDVQDDVHRIIGTGYFASCMPTAEDTRDGVRLIFKVTSPAQPSAEPRVSVYCRLSYGLAIGHRPPVFLPSDSLHTLIPKSSLLILVDSIPHRGGGQSWSERCGLTPGVVLVEVCAPILTLRYPIPVPPSSILHVEAKQVYRNLITGS